MVKVNCGFGENSGLTQAANEVIPPQNWTHSFLELARTEVILISETYSQSFSLALLKALACLSGILHAWAFPFFSNFLCFLLWAPCYGSSSLWARSFSLMPCHVINKTIENTPSLFYIFTCKWHSHIQDWKV